MVSINYDGAWSEFAQRITMMMSNNDDDDDDEDEDEDEEDGASANDLFIKYNIVIEEQLKSIIYAFYFRSIRISWVDVFQCMIM